MSFMAKKKKIILLLNKWIGGYSAFLHYIWVTLFLISVPIKTLMIGSIKI